MNVTEIQSFLDLTRYYRKFTKGIFSTSKWYIDDGSQVMCIGCGRIKEINYGRGSLFCICDASRKIKNVSYPEGTLLVEGHEEICCRVCLQMSYLAAS